MKKQILLVMLLFIITTGCNKKEDDLALLGLAAAGSNTAPTAAATDTTAPADVTGATTSTYKNIMDMTKLSWTDPTDKDFDHVEITITVNSSNSISTKTIAKGVQLYETGILRNEPLKIVIVTVDKTGNKSAGVTINYTPG